MVNVLSNISKVLMSRRDVASKLCLQHAGTELNTEEYKKGEGEIRYTII